MLTTSVQERKPPTVWSLEAPWGFDWDNLTGTSMDSNSGFAIEKLEKLGMKGGIY